MCAARKVCIYVFVPTCSRRAVLIGAFDAVTLFERSCAISPLLRNCSCPSK